MILWNHGKAHTERKIGKIVSYVRWITLFFQTGNILSRFLSSEKIVRVKLVKISKFLPILWSGTLSRRRYDVTMTWEKSGEFLLGVKKFGQRKIFAKNFSTSTTGSLCFISYCPKNCSLRHNDSIDSLFYLWSLSIYLASLSSKFREFLTSPEFLSR